MADLIVPSETQLDISAVKGRKKHLTAYIEGKCIELTNAGYMPGRLLLTNRQHHYLKRARELQDYDFRLYKAQDRIYLNEYCAMELSIVPAR